MSDPYIGRQLGQYQILKALGGKVYQAHQPSMERDVALKIGLQIGERFNAISQLHHSQIVPIYEHGITDDGITYLAMRYFKDGSLRAYMGKGLTLSDVNRLLQQIAGALSYAHAQGIVHRNIKPNNILMDEGGHAYLSDFSLDSEQVATYMAPEQIQSSQSDDRSDIYSLGIVLYEMLAGRPPFVGDSDFAIQQAHLAEGPPPLLRSRPDLKPPIVAVVEKALHKNPVDRYPQVSPMPADFNEAMSAEMASVRLPRAELPVASAPTRRGLHPGILAILLLLVGAVLVLKGSGAAPQAVLAASPTPTTADAARPARGTIDDLKLSDGEIAAARAALGSSSIGMVACTLTTDYHASLARSVRERAQALNLPIQVVDSNADAVKQPVLINQLVAQGAKALIICELDANTVGPALADVAKAGVKVVRFADTVNGPNAVALSFPNETMGHLVGNFTADMVNSQMGGKAIVAILDYPPVPVVEIRANAMKSALLAKAPNVTIVGNYQGGLTDDGEKSMTQALKEHGDINVIMSINDAGAYGAIKALQAAGKTSDEVKIVSVDAEPVARNYIRQGQWFVASVDSGAVDSGVDSVNAMVKLLAGAPVPRTIALPGNIVTKDTLPATQAATQSP